MSTKRTLSALTSVISFAPLLVSLAITPAHAQDLLGGARQYMDNGDYRAAIIELKNVLQADPTDVSARLLLAEAYLLRKDGAGAEKEFLRAADLGADPATWRLNLVEALVLQGKFSDALDRIDEATEPQGAGEKARAAALKGRAQLGMKQFDEAERSFYQAIESDPDNQAAALGTVLVPLAKNAPEQATEAVDRLLARFPENVDALVIRAELHRRNAETAEAAERFAQAMKLDPENILAVLGHARAMLATGNVAQAEADLDRADKIQKNVVMTRYLRGIIAFEAKAWERTAEHLQLVVSEVPDDLQSKLLLGIASFKLGNLRIAEEYLDRVLVAAPGNPHARKFLGATQIKLGEPQKAIRTLEPLARQAPDAQSMALLGSAYVESGDQEKGQEWLQRAVEASPDAASLRTQLGLTLLASGAAGDAITELQTAVDLDPDVLQADVLLVFAHLGAGDVDKALQASQALEERMPESAIARNLTGLALLAQRKVDMARARFREALALDPGFYTAMLNIARVDIAQEKLDAAQKGYEAILAEQPEHLDAMLGMAALAERRGDSAAVVSWLIKAQDTNPDEVQPGLLLANQYITRGDALKALSTMQALARRFPDDPVVIETLGRTQVLAGESASAVRTYERLVRLRPEDAKQHFLLGGARWGVKDLDGATEAFTQALALKPDLVPAQIALANLALQDGRTDDALALAMRLQQTPPVAAVGYEIQGKVHLSQGRPEDAVKAFEKAYAKQQSGQTLRQLAQAHTLAGRRADAIALLEDRLRELPTDHDSQLLLGTYYEAEGRDGEARAAYESFIRANPDNAAVLNNLAWIYQKVGDPRATETAKRAYDLNPKQPAVADTYGWILLQNGKVQEGLTLVQQAYVADPTASEIGYHVAVGLDKANRKDESIKLLHRLLGENPNFPRAEEARALLNKLER